MKRYLDSRALGAIPKAPWRSGLSALPEDLLSETRRLIETEGTELLTEARRRLRRAAEQAAIPWSDYTSLDGRASRAMDTLISLRESVPSDETEYAAWVDRADRALTQAEEVIAEIDAVIGYEKDNRWLKLGLVTAGAVVLLGGTAAVIVYRRK